MKKIIRFMSYIFLKIRNNHITRSSKPTRGQAACGLTHCYLDNFVEVNLPARREQRERRDMLKIRE